MKNNFMECKNMVKINLAEKLRRALVMISLVLPLLLNVSLEAHPIMHSTDEYAGFNYKPKIYYVSPTGNDNNPGTVVSQPFASIGKAAELVKAGDKIFVRGGLYKINQPINITYNGTLEQPVTIMAYRKEVPVLDFSALKGEKRIVAVRFVKSSHTVFEGFELQNGATGINIKWCNNITVRNCRIHDFEYVGLGVASDECLIENNELYRICMAYENCNGLTGGWPQVVNTGSKPAEPPAIVSSHVRNNIFRGNYIHDCWGEGIDPMFSDGVLVENNVIRDVFSVGIYMDGTRNAVIRNNYIYSTSNVRNRKDSGVPFSGILMGSEYFGGWSNYPAISHVENIYIYNNVLSRVGIGVGHWKDYNNTDRKNIYENIRIYNNTIDTYEGKGEGIRFATDLDYPTKGNECKNNIFRCSTKISAEKGFLFENNLWVNGIPESGNHVNSFTGDPGWIDPVQGGSMEGYKLKANSISAGKGQPVSGLSTDKELKPRHNPTSLGAFESVKRIKGNMSEAVSSVSDMIITTAPDFIIGVNIARNSGFEQVNENTPVDWVVSGDRSAFSVNSEGHVPAGSNPVMNENTNCIKIGGENNFSTDVTQSLTGIPDGRYGLHVRVKRFGSSGNFYAVASTSTAEKIICNIPLASSMNEWSSYSKEFFQLNISDILVKDGKCTISFHGDGSPGDYSLIDDVCFYRY